ncbi:MAG: hypothetical protein AAGA55_08235 [Planctomycetota bacterium]
MTHHSAKIPMLNLLPADRQLRRARTAAVARWSTICLLLAVASWIPAGALALTTHDDLTPIRSRIERSRQGLAAIQAERPGLESEIRSLRDRAVMLDQVEQGIDWIPLLGAVAGASYPARFERIEVRTNIARKTIEARFVGLVESQSEARALVLRLENLGVIDDIRLETSRVSLERDLFRFNIDGVIAAELEE